MLVTCSCGTTNRVPSLPKCKVRCGKCRHVFTPTELAKGKPEPPPAHDWNEDLLGVDDGDDGDGYDDEEEDDENY